jgi:hypothetical protein
MKIKKLCDKCRYKLILADDIRDFISIRNREYHDKKYEYGCMLNPGSKQVPLNCLWILEHIINIE